MELMRALVLRRAGKSGKMDLARLDRCVPLLGRAVHIEPDQAAGSAFHMD